MIALDENRAASFSIGRGQGDGGAGGLLARNNAAGGSARFYAYDAGDNPPPGRSLGEGGSPSDVRWNYNPGKAVAHSFDFMFRFPLPPGEGQGEGFRRKPESTYDYDVPGHVAQTVAASTVAPPAQYEYSPFGETLRATGPMAK